MFHAIYIGTVSACFELDNDSPFYSPTEYWVKLDGDCALEGRENVFSLYGLKPGRDYSVALCMGEAEETLQITTRTERCAVSVRDFGAKGDGVTDDTAALQRAISVLPPNGRLIIPGGVYLTGPLILKSHMTLELVRDARLLGLTGKAAYPVLPAMARDPETGEEVPFGSFEGLPREMYAALLTAEYAEDIHIVGSGELDGNAQNADWWRTFKEDPVARPRLCFFNRCRDVVMHGVSVGNSPSWHLHPYYCENVAFYDVSVTAPKDSPNTDALDPECCDGVEIIGCRFSVGDDCIAIKSGKLEQHRKWPAPASRHTIRNCYMSHGHGAVVLGSEISGGVRALSVSQCLFRETDRGLRIKTRRGRGRDCFIDDVAFDNIRMEKVVTPIVMNMYYRCVDPDGDSDYVQGREPLPVDDRTPRLGRFSFSNMNCLDAQAAAAYCDGLPEQPIDAVTLKNVRVAFAGDARPGVPAMFTNAQPCCRLGLYFNNVRRVTLKNVFISGWEGEPIVAHGVDEITTDEFEDEAMCEAIDRYVYSLIERSSPESTIWNVEKARQGKPVNWNYIDGCMVTALLEMSEITGDARYFDFARRFIDAFVSDDGKIRTFDVAKHTLDDINEGRVLFKLYEKTGLERYRRAAETLKRALEEQPRTGEGSFWHKQIYPNQVWLDGIYMALPFLALYEKHFGKGDYSDVVRQIETVRDRMRDDRTGLYYHGYDASRSVFWADRETGRSKSFWLRSIGWFAVALADLMEILPEGKDRDALKPIFRDLMESVWRYSDPETGMYWQVPDHPNEAGNYLESSGSAMLAYAMLKGARLGVLDAAFAGRGRKTFEGIVKKYLTIEGDDLNLDGICLVAGLGPESDHRRDGSYAYYISEPVVRNDAKGVAPFVLCYAEIKRQQT